MKIKDARKIISYLDSNRHWQQNLNNLEIMGYGKLDLETCFEIAYFAITADIRTENKADTLVNRIAVYCQSKGWIVIDGFMDRLRTVV